MRVVLEGRGIRRGNCRLWRPPGYSARSITFPVPHQWPTKGCEVQSKTACCSETSTSSRTHSLQEDLRHLEDWAKKWGMRFNAQKCYILSSRSKSTHMYSLNGFFLKQLQEHRCVPRSDHLRLPKMGKAHCIYNISWKAAAAMGFLPQNPWNCPKECRRLAYIALVRS